MGRSKKITEGMEEKVQRKVLKHVYLISTRVDVSWWWPHSGQRHFTPLPKVYSLWQMEDSPERAAENVIARAHAAGDGIFAGGDKGAGEARA